MKQITLNSNIQRSKDAVYSTIDTETVMISIPKGKYYSMEEVGSRIWQLLKKEIPVYELCRILCEEFDIEKDQCQKDVVDFLNRLAGENLVEVS
jgi:hypothetical protein